MSNLFTPPIEKIKFTKEDSMEDFHYESDVFFDRPLVIRGTKKQYVPYPDIKKMQTLEEGTLETIVQEFERQEAFEVIYLRSISALNPIAIKSEGFFFQVTEELADSTKEHFLFVPFDESTVAFKRLSAILGIPYAFSKKNPGSLNEINFSTWKDRICEEKGRDLPVCIVSHKTQLVNILHEGASHYCQTVYTFLPISSIKKADGSLSLIKKKLSDQIPVLHKLLPAFVEGIQKEFPNVKTILHSVATGFTGGNKGDHYVKILLDSPDLKWDVGGDEFQPTISLRSNFTGEDKNTLGSAFLSVSLMKLTCQNGMMIPLPEENLQTIRDTFVDRLMSMNKIEKDHKDYQKYFLKYSKKFKKKFADFGCMVSLHDIQTNFQGSDFCTLLKVFLSCKDNLVEKSLEDLKVPLGEIKDEDFVEVVESLSKEYKLPSQITKGVILEFLASKQDGIISFPDAYSLVQYVSYMAQAYNSRIQANIERTVISMGLAVTAALVHKAHFRTEAISRYQGMIKQ